jgi:hypothetical protein
VCWNSDDEALVFGAKLEGPGNDWTGVDAYANLNPLEAFSQVPGLAILQIFLFMTYLEVRRINIINEEGSDYAPGDLRILKKIFHF